MRGQYGIITCKILIEGIGSTLTWLSSLFYSLISGLAEVFPVSATAHRIVMQGLLGEGKNHIFLQMFLHIGSLAALFYCCNNQILRLSRAEKLARVPKRRRKRPLDTHSLMDIRFLRVALIPIVAAFFCYDKVAHFEKSLVAVSIFLFLNGILIYIPQYLPGSNKDARSLSPVDSLLIGLGAALSVIPGLSCVGIAVSIAAVRGVDKKFALDMALMMAIFVLIGMIGLDIMSAVTNGIDGLTFMKFLQYLFCGGCAFGGTMLGVRVLKAVIEEQGLSVFALYCWGLALFTFIFYLTAA